MIPNLLTYFPNISEAIQGLETLYAGIILKGTTIFLSICVLIPLLPHLKLVSLTLFSNIYRPWKGLKVMLDTLRKELESVKGFREASPKEIGDYEDVSEIAYVSIYKTIHDNFLLLFYSGVYNLLSTNEIGENYTLSTFFPLQLPEIVFKDWRNLPSL